MLKPIIKIYGKFLDSTFVKKFTKKKTKEELYDFWKNPNKGNLPKEYISGKEKSEVLVNFIKKFGPEKSSKILEIGCNVGRNLNYIQKEGYEKLTGIEINIDAIELMRKEFPELSSHVTIHNEAVEKCIQTFSENEFDIIFSMATLQHIHEDSEFVFKEIAKITKKILIIIEDEKGTSWRHFPRNYKEIFEEFGLKQIEEKCNFNIGTISSGYCARVFTKI